MTRRPPSRPRLPTRCEIARYLDSASDYGPPIRQHRPPMTAAQVAHRLRLDIDDDAMTAPGDKPDRP